MTDGQRQRAEVVAAVCRALRLLAETRCQATMRSADMRQLLVMMSRPGRAGGLLDDLAARLAAIADEADRALAVVAGEDLAELAAAIGDDADRDAA